MNLCTLNWIFNNTVIAQFQYTNTGKLKLIQLVLWELQMHKKHTAQSIFIGKDNFMVTVYPNIDYAFIVALIVILDEINRPKQ